MYLQCLRRKIRILVKVREKNYYYYYFIILLFSEESVGNLFLKEYFVCQDMEERTSKWGVANEERTKYQ